MENNNNNNNNNLTVDGVYDDDNQVASSPSPKMLSTTENHIKDIEKLKKDTNDLLDPAWKEQRNKLLIGKMLELEEPAVTPKMVDFMVQEGVCEAMLTYVTRLNTGQERYIILIIIIKIINYLIHIHI